MTAYKLGAMEPAMPHLTPLSQRPEATLGRERVRIFVKPVYGDSVPIHRFVIIGASK